MMQSEKIQASHRARGACVYVRQSDPYQVKHNLESQRLQYELEEKARQLGFAEVRVIDEDLGRSGTETDKRHGFQNLVLQVSSHALGMILVREASRLARNNADWYHLLDLCGLFDTLIADQDGVYHPALPNDRMVLGLKGMMSEMELGLLKGPACWRGRATRPSAGNWCIAFRSAWSAAPAAASRRTPMRACRLLWNRCFPSFGKPRASVGPCSGSFERGSPFRTWTTARPARPWFGKLPPTACSTAY
jgi:hypothetical protein